MRSRLACVIAVAICLLSAFAAVIATDYFTEFYEDYDTDISSLATAVINSRIVLAAGFVLLSVAIVVKEAILKSRSKLTLYINLVCIFVVGIMLGIISFCLLAPYLLADRYVI